MKTRDRARNPATDNSLDSPGVDGGAGGGMHDALRRAGSYDAQVQMLSPGAASAAAKKPAPAKKADPEHAEFERLLDAIDALYIKEDYGPKMVAAANAFETWAKGRKPPPPGQEAILKEELLDIRDFAVEVAETEREWPYGKKLPKGLTTLVSALATASIYLRRLRGKGRKK